jgi:hypothetical protein
MIILFNFSNKIKEKMIKKIKEKNNYSIHIPYWRGGVLGE